MKSQNHNRIKMQCLKSINWWYFLFIPFFAFSQQEKIYTGNYKEPYRPAFHFTPQTGWMNDPNGLVYLNGKYHLFYQYYPDDIVWGPMHWGHAISEDLLHWKQLPIALYPDSLGWIFSGSAVIDKNNTAGLGSNAMVAIFTYHNDAIWKQGRKNTESQGIAYSLDEGKTWTKFKGNPVLNNSGEQDFRDPKVFWNKIINSWNMVLAAGDRIKIFSSPDLRQWQFESDYHPVVSDEYGIWECPDLFPMQTGEETKWVMIVSQTINAPNGGTGTRYFIGDFNGKTFTAQGNGGWFDYGKDFYAAVTFDNVPGDKRILLSWMSNWQYATVTPATVWRSAMTLPRELTLTKENDRYFIKQQIVSQFDMMQKPIYVEKNIKVPYEKVDTNLSHAAIYFEVGGKTDTLSIALSNKLGEAFLIEVNGRQVIIDRSKSGKTDFSDKFADQKQTLTLEEAFQNFQLIIDQSSVEILINNGKYSLTNQVFPNEPLSNFRITGNGKKRFSNFIFNSIEVPVKE